MNFAALLAVVILNQLVGFLWYGIFFKNSWLELTGKTQESLNTNDPIPYILAVGATILMSIIMARLIRALKIYTPGGGARIGFMLWLGISLTSLVVHYKFIGFPTELILIDSGKDLVSLVLSGIILAIWT